ncbi:hypothetical protein BHE74_00044998 [Ensete ventricosum]|nr:hypothetical protein BHE74_00044998 [Ensete ventricosum]
MLHAGNMRSTGVGAPIVTLMRVFLPLLDCSCKTRPPRWWVPGEVPPTIKLGLIERVKSGVPLEHRSFFSFLDGSGEGESPYLFEGLGKVGSGELVIRPHPSTSVGLGPRGPIWEEDHYYPY